MKILYLSDSLGKPNHPRGIFQYSAGLVTILAELGHTIDLVVEKPPNIINKFMRDEEFLKEQFLSSSIYNSLTYNNRFIIKIPTTTLIDKILFVYTYSNILFSIFLSILKIPYTLFFSVNVWQKIRNHFDEMTCLYSGFEFYKYINNFLIIKDFYLRELYFIILKLPKIKLNAKGYDLILIDNPLNFDIVKDSNAKIVTVIYDFIAFHDTSTGQNAKNIAFTRLKASIKNSDGLIFISQSTQTEFKKYCSKVFYEQVLYPIFTPQHIINTNQTNSSYLTKGYVNLITVVSADIRKNVQGCINALELLPENFCLHIIGKATNALIIPENLKSRVNFTGYITEKVKIKMLSEADILLFIPFSEGFGIPLVEGIYYTGKVVCSDIPIFREVLNSSVGWANPNDPSAIAQSIISESEKAKPTIEDRKEIINRFTTLAQKNNLNSFINKLFNQTIQQ